MIKAIVIMAVLVSSAMLVIPLSSGFNAFAPTSQPNLIPKNSTKVLGAKWWQYLLSVPPGPNPILDDNPCNAKLKGAVFYLVGTIRWFSGEKLHDSTRENNFLPSCKRFRNI